MTESKVPYGQPRIVIAAAGGHAKVVADLIAALGLYALVGATDPRPSGPAAIGSGLNILGTDAILKRLRKEGVSHAAIGLGSIRDTAPRRTLREKLEALGFALPALVHPHAAVSPSAAIGAASQVMAACAVNPGTQVAKGCVINTGAVVEHDCRVGDDAFVGPGAVVGGGVEIGPGAFIGMGAVLLQGVRVGAGAVIGAGAVVLKDVPPRRTAVGVPAALRPAP